MQPGKTDDKFELIAQKSFPANDDLVRVVDFFNRTLKDRKIIFGLSLQKEKNEMTISIYEV
ncbi:MAG: YpmA family protein [Methylocystaceae bacterium]